MMQHWSGALVLCVASWPAIGLAATGAQAQFDQGRACRNGIGVAVDTVRAFELIHAAAQGSHAAAMFTLSNMLMEGEGTARNLPEARRWLEAAAALDYPEALQQLAMHLKDGTMGYERDEARAAQLMREAEHAIAHRARER